MLLLGVLQAQAAGQVAGSFDLLETQVLASSAASVTFSSLSTYAADYQHLQLRMVGKYVLTSNNLTSADVVLNADTGANYSAHFLYGRAGVVESTASTNASSISITNCFPFTAGGSEFGGVVMDFLDAFETTKYKTTKAFSGAHASGEQVVALNSGNWRNTDAITSIAISGPNNFATGSRFSLYGIKAGS